VRICKTKYFFYGVSGQNSILDQHRHKVRKTSSLYHLIKSHFTQVYKDDDSTPRHPSTMRADISGRNAPHERDVAQVKVDSGGGQALVHRHQLVLQEPEIIEIDEGVVAAVLAKLHPWFDLEWQRDRRAGRKVLCL